MSQRICSFDTCDRPVRAKQLCATHYTQQRQGRPLRPIRPTRQGYNLTTEERFFRWVVQDGDCWRWTGNKSRSGYGKFRCLEYEGAAHRWSYEFLRAPIPEGLHIDHLCRNIACVNPWHMEPVTVRVNTLRGYSPVAINARKTHCKWGHEFTSSNTMNGYAGRRVCRTCDNTMRRNKRRRRRAEAS